VPYIELLSSIDCSTSQQLDVGKSTTRKMLSGDEYFETLIYHASKILRLVIRRRFAKYFTQSQV
jgi:hypothetical protein